MVEYGTGPLLRYSINYKVSIKQELYCAYFLPKRIVLGNHEGAVRRGRVGRRKCGPIAYRATSGRLAKWKATALKAEVWVDMVTEGGRRLMAAWRKEEVDAAIHRPEKREATRLGKLLSHTEA